GQAVSLSRSSLVQRQADSLSCFPASLIRVAFLLCLSAMPALGQASRPNVIVTIRNPPEMLVSIKLATPTNSWSFRYSYAGALGLLDCFRKFQSLESGTAVSVKNVSTGEFRLSFPVARFSYVINISPASTSDLPHISWLTNDSGVLMLADLLPDLPEIKRG